MLLRVIFLDIRSIKYLVGYVSFAVLPGCPMTPQPDIDRIIVMTATGGGGASLDGNTMQLLLEAN